MAKGSGGTRNRGVSNNPNLKGAGNTEKQTEHPGNSYSYYWERDAKDYMKEKGGMNDNEADEMLSIIKMWAGSGYQRIRNWQLGRMKDSDIMSDYSKTRANKLESFIEKMPKWAGGTTYRGIASSNKRTFFENFNVGDTWDSKSLNSWTTDWAVGMEFAAEGGSDSVLLRCAKPQNGTSIKNFGAIRRENEIITSGKCRYKVVNKSYDNKGTLILDLEPISNGKVRKE